MTESISRSCIAMSYPLSRNGAYPPAIPKTEVWPYMTIEQDGANVKRALISSHAGTHMDAPNHVIAGGLAITDFAIDTFIFDHPAVISIPMKDCELFRANHFTPHLKVIEDCDLLLIRTGFGPYRKQEPERYTMRNPGFSIEGAQYLRSKFPKLRAIGLDTISLAAISDLDEGMQAHVELLEGEGRAFFIFEDLNMEHDLTQLCQVITMPWLVEGFDSAPCTVMGILGKDLV